MTVHDPQVVDAQFADIRAVDLVRNTRDWPPPDSVTVPVRRRPDQGDVRLMQDNLASRQRDRAVGHAAQRRQLAEIDGVAGKRVRGDIAERSGSRRVVTRLYRPVLRRDAVTP